MAMCDANYVFTYVEIGSQGREGDAGVFSRSILGSALRNNAAHVPLPNSPTPMSPILPYVIVGDEAFPLTNYLMRPYPGRGHFVLPYKEQVYNYRLSRARRTIENTFGILVTRWRLFLRPINADINNAECYIKAAIALHNYLRIENDANYLQPELLDQDRPDGSVRLGRWHEDVCNSTGVSSATRLGSNMNSTSVRNLQSQFADFFVSPVGIIPWQTNFIHTNEQ
jgi:hypothetical protein